MEVDFVEVEVDGRAGVDAGRGAGRDGERDDGRQAAVSVMPSRQLTYNTVRMRRHNVEQSGYLGEGGSQADVIVREMEQQHQLMEDNLQAEELRREALRELPQGLTLKRSVRDALAARLGARPRSRPLPLYKRAKYSLSFARRRWTARAGAALGSLELWHGALAAIEGQFGSGAGAYFRALRRLLALDAALAALLLAFTVLPQALHARAWPLLYGHYSAGRVLGGYSMPCAYLFTALAAAAALAAWLCRGTARALRRNFIESGGGVGHAFSTKLFCGWDFSVTEPRAAALHAAGLRRELQELLHERTESRRKVAPCTRLGQRAANALVSALVLAGIGGLLFGLWALLERRTWDLRLSLVVTGAATLGPALFRAIARLEWYGARARVHVTLARTWLLHVALLVLLLVHGARSPPHECWEDRFGREMYRLVLLESVVSLVALPAFEIVRALLHKRRAADPAADAAGPLLALGYDQAVLWFGLLFAPALAALVAAKLLLLFYVRRAGLRRAARAARPARPARAAGAHAVLQVLLTLSLAAALFAVGSIFFRMPSTHCGPFRDYDYVYMVISEGALRLSARPTLSAALGWLTRPAVLAFLLLLLCAAVYWARARARAQRSTARLLRRMLSLQARDKEFLLGAIQRVSAGEWQYSPRGAAPGDGHTWRYERDVRKPSNSGFHFDASRLGRRAAAGAEDGEDGDSDGSFSWQGAAGR